jgi:hypothetical protein
MYSVLHHLLVELYLQIGNWRRFLPGGFLALSLLFGH